MLVGSPRSGLLEMEGTAAKEETVPSTFGLMSQCLRELSPGARVTKRHLHHRRGYSPQ
ncbi:hypothetical protein LEMLEM_LOCUS12742 [Lemmus lemmus]